MSQSRCVDLLFDWKESWKVVACSMHIKWRANRITNH